MQPGIKIKIIFRIMFTLLLFSFEIAFAQDSRPTFTVDDPTNVEYNTETGAKIIPGSGISSVDSAETTVEIIFRNNISIGVRQRKNHIEFQGVDIKASSLLEAQFIVEKFRDGTFTNVHVKETYLRGEDFFTGNQSLRHTLKTRDVWVEYQGRLQRLSEILENRKDEMADETAHKELKSPSITYSRKDNSVLLVEWIDECNMRVKFSSYEDAKIFEKLIEGGDSQYQMFTDSPPCYGSNSAPYPWSNIYIGSQDTGKKVSLADFMESRRRASLAVKTGDDTRHERP